MLIFLNFVFNIDLKNIKNQMTNKLLLIITVIHFVQALSSLILNNACSYHDKHSTADTDQN